VDRGGIGAQVLVRERGQGRHDLHQRAEDTVLRLNREVIEQGGQQVRGGGGGGTDGGLLTSPPTQILMRDLQCSGGQCWKGNATHKRRWEKEAVSGEAWHFEPAESRAAAAAASTVLALAVAEWGVMSHISTSSPRRLQQASAMASAQRASSSLTLNVLWKVSGEASRPKSLWQLI
jgi:hypothetical protein